MTFSQYFGDFCDVIQPKPGRNITFSWKPTEAKFMPIIWAEIFLSNFTFVEHFPPGPPVKDIEGQRSKIRKKSGKVLWIQNINLREKIPTKIITQMRKNICLLRKKVRRRVSVQFQIQLELDKADAIEFGWYKCRIKWQSQWFGPRTFQTQMFYRWNWWPSYPRLIGDTVSRSLDKIVDRRRKDWKHQR